jgi:hypothetical protein
MTARSRDLCGWVYTMPQAIKPSLHSSSTNSRPAKKALNEANLQKNLYTNLQNPREKSPKSSLKKPGGL